MLKQPLLFTYGCLGNQFFLFTSLFQIQSVLVHLAAYPLLYSTCMTYRTPCHSIGHQVLPIQNCFPRRSKHSKDVPLLTYLQPSTKYLRLY